MNDDVEIQRAYATIGRTYLVQSEAIKEGVASGEVSAKSLLRQAQLALEKSLEVCGRLQDKVSVSDHAAMKARLYLNLGKKMCSMCWIGAICVQVVYTNFHCISHTDDW